LCLMPFLLETFSSVFEFSLEALSFVFEAANPSSSLEPLYHLLPLKILDCFRNLVLKCSQFSLKDLLRTET